MRLIWAGGTVVALWFIADGVSGILVEGHDPDDYATELHRLLADDDLREAMGHKAVRHAETFGWDATADRTLAVYSSALADHRSRP